MERALKRPRVGRVDSAYRYQLDPQRWIIMLGRLVSSSPSWWFTVTREGDRRLAKLDCQQT